jgi:hypothetical protein
VSTESDAKLFKYIATLEKTNEELVKTLTYCVELLAQFKPAVSDPTGWQKMLDAFQETIKVGERIAGDKTLH